jgi:hypothetical protein
MLLRIPRPTLPLIPQTCLHQTRSYRNQFYRKPEVFYQTIVLSDGSSFQVMTTSPKKSYTLARDKFNNPIWTGRRRSSEEDDQNEQLAKFRTSFKGGLGGEEAMKKILEQSIRQEGVAGLTGDTKLDSADALFKLLESKDAYAPTRGREGSAVKADTGKKKGVRT